MSTDTAEQKVIASERKKQPMNATKEIQRWTRAKLRKLSVFATATICTGTSTTLFCQRSDYSSVPFLIISHLLVSRGYGINMKAFCFRFLFCPI